MATHLFRKPGESTWYVRMTVPPNVRKAFGGKSKLSKTTGTSNKAEAMDKRLPILAQWKADIRAAREQAIEAREHWRPELGEQSLTLDKQIDTELLEAMKNPPRGTGGTPAEIMARFEQYERDRDQFLRDAQSLEDAGAEGLVERLRDRLHQEPTTMLDAVQSSAAITRDVMVQIAKQRYSLNSTEIVEATEIIKTPAFYKPVSPITPARLSAFRSYRVKAEVANKTIDQQESKLKKLSAYLRDQGLSLTHVTIAAWLETLGITSKTKTQYLLAGSTFWQWAIKHDVRWQNDYAEVNNPFTDHELPKVRTKVKAETARKAFTIEEIESLYAAAKVGGNETLCDLIMLGSYTGCRIEEIAQLRKDSIVTVEGIRTFKINESKTVAGIREIPIHPSLTEVVDHLISKSPDGFLLPSSSGNKYGIRSDPLSKAFGRLKKAQGFGSRHVFHSVRSMVVTLLLRAGVPGPTVANIVGHETGLVTFDVYDEGASPQQKLDALCNLSFKFLNSPTSKLFTEEA
ncbi:tyrosine-type recombinase/integrase [Pseudomonas helleri]|uniref:tyrosine-type recombinase/integrase n=1 Tax=Pseudomonas helleri TaxID=1608996 RepID=UPI0028EF9EE3|nr:tyrosine-type recombinase/integrase [Pseudomonas helleri]